MSIKLSTALFLSFIGVFFLAGTAKVFADETYRPVYPTSLASSSPTVADWTSVSYLSTAVCPLGTGGLMKVGIHEGSYPSNLGVWYDVYTYGTCNNDSYSWLTALGGGFNPMWLWQSNSTLLPQGDYWVEFYSQGNDSYYWDFSVDSNGDSDGLNYDSTTRVITVSPSGIIATSTVYNVNVIGHLNLSDWNSKSQLTVELSSVGKSAVYGQCADAICSVMSHGLVLEYDLDTFGQFEFTTQDLDLAIGEYEVNSQIHKGIACVFGSCLLSTVVYSTTTYFTISTSTAWDIGVKRLDNVLSVLANRSDSEDFSKCAILDFNLLDCGLDLITYVFVPTGDAFSYNIDLLYDDVLTKFPIGYLTDFITIVATTSTSTMPVIDTQLPAVLGLGTDNIRLDLTHVLDPFLHATSTIFNTSSENDTRTLEDITMDYWTKIIAVLTLFYMLSRIVGSVYVPNFGLVDRSSSVINEDRANRYLSGLQRRKELIAKLSKKK